jgi:hypothetical protein
MAFTRCITRSGIGNGVNEHRLRIRPVVRQKNLTLPCRLPVGPTTMVSWVHVVIVLEGNCSS